MVSHVRVQVLLFSVVFFDTPKPWRQPRSQKKLLVVNLTGNSGLHSFRIIKKSMIGEQRITRLFPTLAYILSSVPHILE